jgi:hypothetical protein
MCVRSWPAPLYVRQSRMEHRKETEVRQDYLWKVMLIDKHRRLSAVHKGNTVTCSLLSARVLLATLTGFQLKLGHRDSCEVILTQL